MKSRKRDDRWHARKRRQMVVGERDGIALIDLGKANVWDYGDLVRLREVVSGLVFEGQRRISLDLSHVGCLPSGFMNMLCEWQERGIEVYVLDPRPNVRNMLWFQTFTERVSESRHRVTCTHKDIPPEGHWNDDIGSGDEIPEACDSWA
ncbi:MAG: hypothetical protein M3552_22760 [Planctomycetota bacterium]|nr:hypothetical protein [Planctomycetaceae bacterium]MDQ3333430.1 hypothetical protein [Planctomycetota bacterium]